MKLGQMKHGVLYLIIAIPLASVIMGVVSLYVAFSNADVVVTAPAQPLSKSSWQEPPVER